MVKLLTVPTKIYPKMEVSIAMKNLCLFLLGAIIVLAGCEQAPYVSPFPDTREFTLLETNIKQDAEPQNYFLWAKSNIRLTYSFGLNEESISQDQFLLNWHPMRIIPIVGERKEIIPVIVKIEPVLVKPDDGEIKIELHPIENKLEIIEVKQVEDRPQIPIVQWEMPTPQRVLPQDIRTKTILHYHDTVVLEVAQLLKRGESYELTVENIQSFRGDIAPPVTFQFTVR